MTIYYWDDSNRDLLHDWVSRLSSANHHFALHCHSTWVDRWGVPYADRQAVAYADHSLVIVLQETQIRWGVSPDFACMEHDDPETPIENSSSGGDEKRVVGLCGWIGACCIGPLRHGILWWIRVYSHHPWISSPHDSWKMAPAQAVPFPLCPLFSLVCHQLVWPLQYIVLKHIESTGKIIICLINCKL